jgi:hypothetical protein
VLKDRRGIRFPDGLIDGRAFKAAISGQIGIAYAAYGALGLVLLAYAGIRRVISTTKPAAPVDVAPPIAAREDAGAL